jgi:hypothetical protein
MNILHFGWPLALLGLTAFACNDDSDQKFQENGAATLGSSSAGSSSNATANDAGSAGEGGATSVTPLELIGEYTDDYASPLSITATGWNEDTIAAYDNAENFVITLSPASAMYSPNTYTRIVYTEPVAGSFYFCYVDFGLTTLEAALGSLEVADASDPENAGCGMFPWSKATKN